MLNYKQPSLHCNSERCWEVKHYFFPHLTGNSDFRNQLRILWSLPRDHTSKCSNKLTIFSGPSEIVFWCSIIFTWYFLSIHSWICFTFVLKSCCSVTVDILIIFCWTGPVKIRSWVKLVPFNLLIGYSSLQLKSKNKHIHKHTHIHHFCPI